MVRRVRRKLSSSEDRSIESVGSNSDGECTHSRSIDELDWTKLPDDTVIQLLSNLNYRDRASLSSTCRTFRLLGSSSCLWESLDLRPYKIDFVAASSLSLRCKGLKKIRFRGAEAADAIIKLEARQLRDISGELCRDITDATLSAIAARHEMLEILQLGPDACEIISSDAIKAIAMCCSRLKKLQLSGVWEINAEAINALARHCGNLVELAFLNSESVDETALGNLSSLQFLSVAGTRNIKWDSASEVWSKIPKLVGLDVSRTDISMSSVIQFSTSFQNLTVLLALNCPVFEGQVDNEMKYNHKGKLILTVYNNILAAIASLFADNTENERKMSSSWSNFKNKDRRLTELVNWLEQVLSHSLLQIAENNPDELHDFWLKQGTKLLLNLMQSSQDDVQERAASAAANFVVVNDESAAVDHGRAQAVIKDGGVQLLLDLAKSCHEGLQSEAAKAIANLSVDSDVAKVVAEIGGINILAGLARSMNRLIAEEAAGGLWNLSVGEDHKGAIVEAGGIQALVDLIFKWPSKNDAVLERAAGALANLAADDKCSMKVTMAGGVQALVMLARSCKFEGVQEQAARALSNLAGHGEGNISNAAVGREAGAIETLVQLTCSQHEGVRQEAAGALWNLSFDDKNREEIAAAGGVVALVSLARSCANDNSSKSLQERAAGALWGLSVSEANCVAIGQAGGVLPLLTLARSKFLDVHETAAGALWNLAFNPSNALRIMEDGGVADLVNLCCTSQSKMARLMASLALVYMFDGRMDDVAAIEPLSEGTSRKGNPETVRKTALKYINDFVLSFSDTQSLATVLVSSAPVALAQVAEAARIPEAGHLRCSAAEIGRFVAMLRNPSPVLKSCSAFALFQFTMPGGRHALHHAGLLQNTGAPRVLRSAAAAAAAPIEAKLYAKIVLRNLEQLQLETLNWDEKKV